MISNNAYSVFWDDGNQAGAGAIYLGLLAYVITRSNVHWILALLISSMMMGTHAQHEKYGEVDLFPCNSLSPKLKGSCWFSPIIESLENESLSGRGDTSQKNLVFQTYDDSVFSGNPFFQQYYTNSI